MTVANDATRSTVDDAPRGRRTIERLDPATGEVLGTLAVAGNAEVRSAVAAARSAVAAARAAADAWAATPASERAAMVRHAADRLEQRAEQLAGLTTAEMGKPLGDAAGGVAAAVGTARQYAELGPLHRGRTLQVNSVFGGTRYRVIHMEPAPRP
jgi:acyl-CoA reductase-like NAD-dependent aldehyde dehydrogenase